jgi:hypothetical protein
MPLTFAKPRLMRWNSNAITDHKRSPLAISNERIEKSNRMANGTLRKYVVADKRTFTVSWEMLPRDTAKTVDGFWGGSAMESFFHSTTGSFTLEITEGDGTVTNYTVMFSGDFDKEIISRGGNTDLWNVSVSMVEV